MGQADLLPACLPHAGGVPLIPVQRVVDVFLLLGVITGALLVEAFVAANEAGHGAKIATLALDAKSLGIVPLGHQAHANTPQLSAADDAIGLAGDVHEDQRMLPGHPDEMRGRAVATEFLQASLSPSH